MICCDKCQDKQVATRKVAWGDIATAINPLATVVLCDKCYKEFMTLFGNSKGAKLP